MSDKSPVDFPSSPDSDPPSGGTSRFVGVGVSLITGLIVFTVGASWFPYEPPRSPDAPSLGRVEVPATATPTGGAAPTTADAPSGAGGAGGSPATNAADPSGEGGAKAERAAAKPAEAAPAADANAADASAPSGHESAADASTTAKADDTRGESPTPAPAADCTLPEKDIAREAWRHNWPTICPVPNSAKGFIIIPFKGSSEKAAVELKRKPVREARVTLPSGEAMLSMKLYKLGRLGFKDLRIGPPDEGAAGTRFRVRLMNGAGDPVVDVKDSYAKITVANPTEATE